MSDAAREPWFAALRDKAAEAQLTSVRAVIDGGLLLALLDIAEAAQSLHAGLTCEHDPMDVDERIARLGAALAGTSPSHDSGQGAAEGATPMSDAAEKVIQILVAIAENEQADPDTRVRAARALLDLEKFQAGLLA